ncbi:MAG: hypothetical protein IKJ18_00130 [Bacteroidaceae bacterium]|nr:hypothetical protein [Bacteroidaceae bacterium]
MAELLVSSDKIIGAVRSHHRSAGDFLAGSSGIFRRLLRLLPKARQIVAAGAGDTYIWVFRNQPIEDTDFHALHNLVFGSELLREDKSSVSACCIRQTSTSGVRAQSVNQFNHVDKKKYP